MIESATTQSVLDDLRLANYRKLTTERFASELDDQTSAHQASLERLNEQFAQRQHALENSYNVQISREAEALDTKLQKIKATNQQRIVQETERARQEEAKIALQSRAQIVNLQKNANAQIESIQKQLQDTSNTLHELSKKRNPHA